MLTWRWIRSRCSVGMSVGGAARVASGCASRARKASGSARRAPIPRDREDRLFQALGRLEQNHRVDLAANDAYERWRATAATRSGGS